MTFDKNPFPEGDADRHALWEMLVRRDIDAFLGQDWAMVEDDFIAESFFGMHAHFLNNADAWRLQFPTGCGGTAGILPDHYTREKTPCTAGETMKKGALLLIDDDRELLRVGARHGDAPSPCVCRQAGRFESEG